MNTIVIIIFFLIIILLLWTFFGSTSEEKTGALNDDLEAKAEKVLRRRATDREIEEEFPDDSPRRRRKSDFSAEETESLEDTSFQLPYLADDIISDTSRFRIYKRTLKNSEIYAVKGDFSTAISLYNGVHERINDHDTRFKIEANIDYLNNFKEHKKEAQQKRKQEALKKQNEVKFKVDGQMPQEISIGIIDQQKLFNTDEIAEKVISQIKGDIKDELDDISDQLSKLKDDFDAEKVNPPALTEAKYDKPVPLTIDPQPILDILNKLPGTKDKEIEKADDRKQEEETHEKKFQKTIDEDENDFELLSEYGKDKTGDELSDEEIFEKILQDTNDESDTDSFEIIGDRKSDDTEVDILDKNREARLKEEENFYRNLIKTDRRIKKELPILKVSYDFTRLPDQFSLSREKNILEYSFYKYKDMLEKASDFIKRRRVREAINYYRVVMSQNIPPEFKAMIRQNIRDLTEYLEKYLTTD